jgi:hypothetical protein
LIGLRVADGKQDRLLWTPVEIRTFLPASPKWRRTLLTEERAAASIRRTDGDQRRLGGEQLSRPIAAKGGGRRPAFTVAPHPAQLELGIQCVRKPRHDFVLHIEQICDGLVEAFSPKVSAACHIDYLHVRRLVDWSDYVAHPPDGCSWIGLKLKFTVFGFFDSPDQIMAKEHFSPALPFNAPPGLSILGGLWWTQLLGN